MGTKNLLYPINFTFNFTAVVSIHSIKCSVNILPSLSPQATSGTFQPISLATDVHFDFNPFFVTFSMTHAKKALQPLAQTELIAVLSTENMVVNV